MGNLAGYGKGGLLACNSIRLGGDIKVSDTISFGDRVQEPWVLIGATDITTIYEQEVSEPLVLIIASNQNRIRIWLWAHHLRTMGGRSHYVSDPQH